MLALAHPDQRVEAFTEKVVLESIVHSICLLTIIELYKAICAIREKTVAPEAIRQKILGTKGICKLL